MVEGKAMMLKLLNVTPNLLESLVAVIPHCAKVVAVLFPCKWGMPPSSPVQLKGTCPWLLTGHLLLATIRPNP